jgi:predicted TIM-barrel fold metal-dependent hydrolase
VSLRLPIVDADGHVLEPVERLVAELPARLREGPQASLRGSPSRREMEYSLGSLCTPGSLARGGRLDIDFASEVDRGVDDPRRRLALMDAQGVAVSVLFPTMVLGLDALTPDVEARHVLASAYNDWIADFCRSDPVRLRWVAVVPLARVDLALRELARAAGAGAAGVMLSPFPTADGRDLGSPEHDPFWAQLAEAGLPAVVHASEPNSEALGMRHHWRNRTRWQMGVPIQLQLALLAAIDGGVFERFPRVEIGFFEGDVGWLPHWLGRLDETYEKMALVSKVPKRSAVEQFRAQGAISGEPADLGFAHAVRLVGAERVLFASDWPHQDGAWPDPIATLVGRTDLADEEKRRILVDGPARFFRVDLGRLLAHLGPGWTRAAPLEGLPGMLQPLPA